MMPESEERESDGSGSINAAMDEKAFAEKVIESDRCKTLNVNGVWSSFLATRFSFKPLGRRAKFPLVSVPTNKFSTGIHAAAHCSIARNKDEFGRTRRLARGRQILRRTPSADCVFET